LVSFFEQYLSTSFRKNISSSSVLPPPVALTARTFPRLFALHTNTCFFSPQFLYLVSSTAIVRLSILSGWGERIFVQSFPVPQPDRFRGRMRHPLQWRRDDDRIVQRWIQRGSQKLVIWTDPILLFFGNMLPDSRCHDFERENEFLFMAARCQKTSCP
jgi:hypothetical protein